MPQESGFDIKERRNRDECTRSTVRAYRAHLYPFGSSNITLRYRDPSEQFAIFAASELTEIKFTDTIDQLIKRLVYTGTVLTDEKLQEFIQQGEQAELNISNAILLHAQTLGLSQIQSPEEVKNNVNETYLVESVVEEEQQPDIKPIPWIISTAKKSDAPIFSVPQRADDGQLTFVSVNLDILYKADPSFLPQRIREYELAQNIRNLAYRIESNIQLHDIQGSELVPRFMSELANVEIYQSNEVIESIIVFLTHMAKLGSDFSELVYDLKRSLIYTRREKSDGSGAHIDEFLRHKSVCSTETRKTRDEYKLMLQLYEAIQAMEMPRSDSDIDAIPSLGMKIIKHPAEYAVYTDQDIDVNRVNREKTLQVINFIQESVNFTSQEQFLEALRIRLPDLYGTLQEFQKWLKDPYSERDAFESFIEQIAKIIARSGEKFGFEELIETLERTLQYYPTHTSKKFDGVRIDSSKTPTVSSISNSHLKILLPLISILSARRIITSQQDSSGNPQEKQVIICDELSQNLIQQQEALLQSIDQSTQKLEAKKEALVKFRSHVGISDGEMAQIIELTRLQHEIPLHSGRSTDVPLFTTLFNILVLEKQGSISGVHTKPFIELLKTLLPNRRETIWQAFTDHGRKKR